MASHASLLVNTTQTWQATKSSQSSLTWPTTLWINSTQTLSLTQMRRLMESALSGPFRLSENLLESKVLMMLPSSKRSRMLSSRPYSLLKMWYSMHVSNMCPSGTTALSCWALTSWLTTSWIHGFLRSTCRLHSIVIPLSTKGSRESLSQTCFPWLVSLL